MMNCEDNIGESMNFLNTDSFKGLNLISTNEEELEKLKKNQMNQNHDIKDNQREQQETTFKLNNNMMISIKKAEE